MFLKPGWRVTADWMRDSCYPALSRQAQDTKHRSLIPTFVKP